MSMIHFGRQVQGRAVQRGQPISLPPFTYARPRPTGRLAITGADSMENCPPGTVLGLSLPTWTGSPTLSYLWTLDNVPVGTAATYTAPASGGTIRCRQTAKFASGLANTVTSEPVYVNLLASYQPPLGASWIKINCVESDQTTFARETSSASSAFYIVQNVSTGLVLGQSYVLTGSVRNVSAPTAAGGAYLLALENSSIEVGRTPSIPPGGSSFIVDGFEFSLTTTAQVQIRVMSGAQAAGQVFEVQYVQLRRKPT